MKIWPALLLIISVSVLILVFSQFKNLSRGTVNLAIVGLTGALVLEFFHLKK